MYQGFPLRLLDALPCPVDGGQLRAETDEPRLRHATLECGDCRTRLLVRDGIVDVISEQHPPDETVRREIVARDREAEAPNLRSSQRSSPRDDLEIPSTLAGIAFSSRDVVDLGCGTGRITSRVLTAARSVLATDFSRRSLEAFASAIQRDADVGLVLGDVTSLRLAANSFDIALSTQVVEHIPTPGARSEFFRSVRDALRPGGVFVCTVYHHDLRSRLGRIGREGIHESGIFYHRFTRREIKAEVAPHFEVVSVHPIKVAIPYLVRLPLPWGPVSRTLERVPVVNSLGHLLRVVARKPATESFSVEGNRRGAA